MFFSQVSLFNDFFENLKGKKRTWANPMSSKQWKSLYEIDNFTFLFVYVFFLFLKKCENDDFRGPFGITILVKTVIFIKFQGGFQAMMVIWSGRFGSAPVQVLVICKVAVRRL